VLIAPAHEPLRLLHREPSPDTRGVATGRPVRKDTRLHLAATAGHAGNAYRRDLPLVREYDDDCGRGLWRLPAWGSHRCRSGPALLLDRFVGKIGDAGIRQLQHDPEGRPGPLDDRLVQVRGRAQHADRFLDMLFPRAAHDVAWPSRGRTGSARPGSQSERIKMA